MTYYMRPYRRFARLADWMTNDTPTRRTWTGSDVHVPINVWLDDETYVVTALVPGLTAEDLDIEVLNNTITISGELPTVSDEENSYLLREIPAGKFRRVFRLPVALNPTEAEATIHDGVLSLRVPKAEEAKAKRITVNVK